MENKMFCLFDYNVLQATIDRQKEKELNKITGWKWGWRTNPITKIKQFHNGIDLPAKNGTPIYVPWDFIVKRIGLWGVTKQEKKNNISGNLLQLLHPKNSEIVETRYAHLTDWDEELKNKLNNWAETKELVKAGTIIGYVGNTGRSLGAHLHFITLVKEPYICGGLKIRHVDPFPYVIESLKK